MARAIPNDRRWHRLRRTAHVKAVLLESSRRAIPLDEPMPRVHLWELADSQIMWLFGYLEAY